MANGTEGSHDDIIVSLWTCCCHVATIHKQIHAYSPLSCD